jgi:hypothetical protein
LTLISNPQSNLQKDLLEKKLKGQELLHVAKMPRTFAYAHFKVRQFHARKRLTKCLIFGKKCPKNLPDPFKKAKFRQII